jgi:hypothetical protein
MTGSEEGVYLLPPLTFLPPFLEADVAFVQLIIDLSFFQASEERSQTHG